MRSRTRSLQFSYRELTATTYHAIKLLMEEARKRGGVEGQQRREWAYGMYLGWRALMIDRIPPSIFRFDDRVLEALMAIPQP